MNGVTFEVERPSNRAGALSPGRDYRLRSDELFRPLASDGPPRVSDLLGLAAAVYSIDRLVKRNYQSSIRGPGRVIRVRARVADPGFWIEKRELLRDIFAILSGDQWRFEFEQGVIRQWQSSLLTARDTICLYSGGLDSLAGLAQRLQDGLNSVTAVTMLHVGRQRSRVTQHMAALNNHFGNRVFPVLVPMALINPPRLDDQELSQRCRGFIFASLGIGAASATGAERIEVYENGVGALNVPLMLGMSVGGRTTKGCHPRFMDLMTELGSAVLDRPITFCLPFSERTKGEVVSSLRDENLRALALTSFSCIHTSPRTRGEPKHCGVCPACIGRRQAFVAGGVPDDPNQYLTDILAPDSVNALPDERSAFLKATLMQVALLAGAGQGLPREIEHYFRSSDIPEVASSGWPNQTAMLHRYRSEWEDIAEEAAERGVNWANWLGTKHGQGKV